MDLTWANLASKIHLNMVNGNCQGPPRDIKRPPEVSTSWPPPVMIRRSNDLITRNDLIKNKDSPKKALGALNTTAFINLDMLVRKRYFDTVAFTFCLKDTLLLAGGPPKFQIRCRIG
jgi:hypothetical protein